ncbi:MAG: dockerin type I repeat-containing protein [Ruminococcus sp.]|nr:dockerin type I repeat-containing protein [Ruminococcus sp.]
MKKWTKLTAMLASAALLCSSMPLMQASALWYWGDAPTDYFRSSMQKLDGKGMISATDVDYELYAQHISEDIVTEETNPETGEKETVTKHIETDKLYFIIPKTNVLRYVLRDHADAEQAAEIVQTIFPDYQPTEHWSDELIYDLYVSDINYRTEENSAKLKQELAKAGLISHYYTWGQVGYYQDMLYGQEVCPTGGDWLLTYDPEPFGYQPVFDAEQVEQYLEENEIDCTVQKVVEPDNYWDTPSGKREIVHYQIIPNGEMSFVDQFALGADIYEKFGYRIGLTCLETVAELEAVGENGLEMLGDANVDCDTDISDAILTARYAAEDTAVKLTEIGISNADMNGDGIVNGADSTAIVRKIARLE